MKRQCHKCRARYDDAEQWTICPHDRLKSPEMQAQWEVGYKLLGHRIRFAHMPEGSGYDCIGLTFEGMVSIAGLPGEFAPHLFVIDEPFSIAVEGAVS
jgi:hypothetical protein